MLILGCCPSLCAACCPWPLVVIRVRLQLVVRSCSLLVVRVGHRMAQYIPVPGDYRSRHFRHVLASGSVPDALFMFTLSSPSLRSLFFDPESYFLSTHPLAFLFIMMCIYLRRLGSRSRACKRVSATYICSPRMIQTNWRCQE